jgi:quinol monooxygenase YgiN
MIHVIAAIDVAEGQRANLLAEFQKIVPLVRDEVGCLEYGAAVDAETDIAAQADPRPNVVTVVEKWESLDALKAHLAAPHMVEYRSRVKEYVVTVTLQVLDPA